MALTGELTDLSLAELIEFFCNQRKTGRLAVAYPHAPAYFYLQSGSVVHASIGSLRPQRLEMPTLARTFRISRARS